jgi:hypothetical protein
MVTPGRGAAAVAAAPARAVAPSAPAPVVVPSAAAPAPAGAAPSPAPALNGLFEEAADAAPAAAEPATAAPAPAGPPWPVPPPLAVCKAAAMQLLKDKTAPADAPASLVASARRITGMLSSAERAALEKAGAESHLAESLVARIALDAATSEGVKFFSASPAANIDTAAVAALNRQSDDAAARLQKEANAAVSKGEVESLQMITAASAALSRDHLHFKETGDRLRGLSAAPRLGAGALDPDLVLPGAGPRPAVSKPGSAAPQVRAELRDFRGLEVGGRARPKTVFMIIAVIAFVAALANAIYFSVPHHALLSAEAAGPGIERIDVSGEAALVTVSQEWLARADTALPQLVAVLRESSLKKAVLMLPNGNPAGVLDVATGKVGGLARPKGAAPPK